MKQKLPHKTAKFKYASVTPTSVDTQEVFVSLQIILSKKRYSLDPNNLKMWFTVQLTMEK
jgi:hypothetical protein